MVYDTPYEWWFRSADPRIPDGPRTTRVTILTLAGVSIMTPLIAFAIHLQSRLSRINAFGHSPLPSLRINTASVLATVADLVFLAIAWELLRRSKVHRLFIYLHL